MPRTVQGPPAGLEYSYEAKIDGEPSGVTVVLRVPTEADKRRFGEAFETRISTDEDGKPIRDPAGGYAYEIKPGGIERWRRAYLVGCVVRVEGYTASDGSPIETGADLFEHGESEIVSDVISEIQSGYTLSAEKKSGSEKQSGSQAGASPRSDGIVRNAEPAGSIIPAAVSREQSASIRS